MPYLYKCGPHRMQDTPGWHHCPGGTYTMLEVPDAAVELMGLDGWYCTLGAAIEARDAPPAPAPAPARVDVVVPAPSVPDASLAYRSPARAKKP